MQITVELHFKRAPEFISTREAPDVDSAVDQAVQFARTVGWPAPVVVKVHGPDRYVYTQRRAAKLWREFAEVARNEMPCT